MMFPEITRITDEPQRKRNNTFEFENNPYIFNLGRLSKTLVEIGFSRLGNQ